MKVICISGKAGAGKDVAGTRLADVLKDKGYKVQTAHYADLLKYTLRTFYGWDGNKDEKGRNLLQNVGQKVRTSKKDFWIDFLIDIANLLLNNSIDYLIIPDTRYPNEIERWKDSGYQVKHIRVVSDRQSKLTPEQQRHPSETSLDGYIYDEVIRNNGTLDELKETCKALVELKWGL